MWHYRTVRFHYWQTLHLRLWYQESQTVGGGVLHIASLSILKDEELLTFIASIVPYEAFPTLNGKIMLGGGNDSLYKKMCVVLGYAGWAADPRFRDNASRVRNREVLVSMISEVTRQKTTEVRIHW